MKKVPFLIFFAVCVVMLLTPPCANAGTFLGKFCFEAPNINDVFIMNVETVGEGSFITLAVTGMNMTQNRGLSGGGVLIGNTVKLFMGETAFARPIYLGQLHSIVFDLSTMTGADDIVLHNGDGTHTILLGEPISMVPCP
jgi:hypothetical protein